MAMQNIGGLPAVRNDENHNGIEFWALLTQDGSKLNLEQLGLGKGSPRGSNWTF